MRLKLFILCVLMGIGNTIHAQELQAKVTINHQQVGNTTQTEIFDELQQKVTAFLNEHQWTGMKFEEKERIACSFNITVNTYSDTDNSFKCTLLMSSSRPVFNSNYTTTVYSVNDKDFNFAFQQTDQFEYAGADHLDNNLVAMLAYYAYMIIGYDLDSFSPLGGTKVFQQAEDIVTQAENLGYAGWKAFGDRDNRFALLNDLMDGAMEPYRQLTYQYYRKGLDQMADNADAARDSITASLNLLQEAYEAKNMSKLPQLFTEYKRDELLNIYKGKGKSSDRDAIYEILFRIDPSQSAKWDELKK